MKQILKSAVLASLMLTGASGAFSQAAMAQDSGSIIAGLAVANLDAVVANTNAFRTAQQQRPTTYKPQFDQVEVRKKQIETQLAPLVDKFNKDRAAPAPNAAALQQQVQVIQGIQQSGQQELQRILQPVAYSEAYVTEQIEAKLDEAIKAAMAKKKVSLVINPQAVVAANGTAYNLNQDILNELNTLIPSAQLVPPAGWEPREVREQRAQQQAQAGAAAPAPAAAGAKPAPQGR